MDKAPSTPKERESNNGGLLLITAIGLSLTASAAVLAEKDWVRPGVAITESAVCCAITQSQMYRQR